MPSFLTRNLSTCLRDKFHSPFYQMWVNWVLGKRKWLGIATLNLLNVHLGQDEWLIKLCFNGFCIPPSLQRLVLGDLVGLFLVSLIMFTATLLTLSCSLSSMAQTITPGSAKNAFLWTTGFTTFCISLDWVLMSFMREKRWAGPFVNFHLDLTWNQTGQYTCTMKVTILMRASEGAW